MAKYFIMKNNNKRIFDHLVFHNIKQLKRKIRYSYYLSQFDGLCKVSLDNSQNTIFWYSWHYSMCKIRNAV